jgi:hypothetical protein
VRKALEVSLLKFVVKGYLPPQKKVLFMGILIIKKLFI